jgi:hypothetical protein
MNFYDGCSLDFYASYENANYWNQGDAAKIAYEKSRDRTWKNNGAIEVSFTDGNFAPVRDGECSAAWNRSGTVKEETYPVYSYAFEDTKVGDYDMNDVVIKAQETANGKINLKVVACGATLNLNIRLYPAGTRSTNEVAHYDGSPETLTYNGQDEVHLMLGAEAGAMVNTGSSATARPITIQIDKGNYDPAHLPLAIFSAAQGEIRLAGSGQAPYGVIIPEDWSWPRERICITQAYNEAGHCFADFAATVGTAEDWYKHPTNWVMNEASLGY